MPYMQTIGLIIAGLLAAVPLTLGMIVIVWALLPEPRKPTGDADHGHEVREMYKAFRRQDR